jgi:hypothetical protein
MKVLGKIEYWASMSMQIDWGANLVLSEYIDEILNLFNMETIRTVLVAWKRLEQESIVLTLDEWNHKNDFINLVYHDMLIQTCLML